MGASLKKLQEQLQKKLQTKRYTDRESLPAPKPCVLLPRATHRDLERMRERARRHAACGYSVGAIADLLGVSGTIVRSLLGVQP
jgi:hypothetical protein